MTAKILPSGVYTPVPTFFKKDLETLDIDTQVKHAKFLHSNGIKGVVVNGSTGELAHLTRDERAHIVKSIRDSIDDEEFYVIGGVGQNGSKEALTEIESLKKAGASHVLVLPSSYFGATTTQDGIIDWYTNIADNSTLPVLIYVYPGVTNGVFIDPETIVKLSQHKNIVGTKISHGDVSHYTLVGLDPKIYPNPDNFKFFTGLGNLFLPSLILGGQGTVDAISGAFPKPYVQLYEAFQKKDFETAKKLQRVITQTERIVEKFGIIGIKKTVYSKGFGETYLGRAPINKDIIGEDNAVFNTLFQELDELSI